MTAEDLELMKKWKAKWMEVRKKPYDRDTWKALEEQMAKELEPVTLTDEDKKTLFKDYGCRNGWSWQPEVASCYSVVRALHELDKKRNPSAHQYSTSTPYTCYHVEKCTCGLKTSYDSGG